jgi:hypothetical protein
VRTALVGQEETLEPLPGFPGSRHWISVGRSPCSFAPAGPTGTCFGNKLSGGSRCNARRANPSQAPIIPPTPVPQRSRSRSIAQLPRMASTPRTQHNSREPNTSDRNAASSGGAATDIALRQCQTSLAVLLSASCKRGRAKLIAIEGPARWWRFAAARATISSDEPRLPHAAPRPRRQAFRGKAECVPRKWPVCGRPSALRRSEFC